MAGSRVPARTAWSAARPRGMDGRGAAGPGAAARLRAGQPWPGTPRSRAVRPGASAGPRAAAAAHPGQPAPPAGASPRHALHRLRALPGGPAGSSSSRPWRARRSRPSRVADRLATIAVPAVPGLHYQRGRHHARDDRADRPGPCRPADDHPGEAVVQLGGHGPGGPARDDLLAGGILGLLSHPSPVSPDYVVLKRSIPATAASRISALNLPGIAMTPSYTRVYPNGDLAANVVGFTNTTASGALQGEAGVEQSYNPLLAWPGPSRRCRWAPTASRSRWRARVSGRWSRAATSGSRSWPACSGRPSRPAPRKSRRPTPATAPWSSCSPARGRSWPWRSRRRLIPGTRPTWPTPPTCRSPTCSTPAAPPR